MRAPSEKKPPVRGRLLRWAALGAPVLAAVALWLPAWPGDLLASGAAALGAGALALAALAIVLRRRAGAISLALLGASALTLTAIAPRAPSAKPGQGRTISLLTLNAQTIEPGEFHDLLAAVDADIVVAVEAPWNLHKTAVPGAYAWRHLESPHTGGPGVRAIYSRWPGRALEPDLPDRSVFSAQIEHPDLPIGVVVLHARSPRTPARWQEGNRRTRQAGRLGADLASAGVRTLIAGDFNSPPTGLRSRRLAQMGFRRARPLLQFGGSYPSWLWAPLTLSIDGAAVGDGFAVRSWRTIEFPGSDHRAVLIELALVDP